MWKYCNRISKWLFLILFLPFIHTFPFIYLFFLLVFPPPHMYPTISTYPSFSFSFSSSFRITCVCVEASNKLLPLCFFFFLSLSLTQTHKFLSLYLTQTNSLSYTHRSPAEKWRLAFYKDRRSTIFFFGLISFILLLRFH